MIPKPDPKSLLTPLLLLGDITFFPFKLGWTKGTDLKYDATKLCGEYDLVTEIKWLPELDVAKRTETADQRSRLPIPDPSFKGKIGKTFADSTPDFPPGVTAPEGAPNVVVILLDDVGFGQPGTFGGPVPTPKIDQLAAQGLRFNRFHTTGICSPTRASLLTGRNHHTVANGTITELSTGYPGYNSILPKSAATVARILRENGYSTGMWGKNHNAPDWETHAVGPFDHWPTGMGFEYFYGVHGGETSQWEPQLYLNTTAVEPSKTAEQGYHLTEDLVDNAIEKALAMVAGKTIDTAPPAAAAVPGHVLKVGDPAPKLCPGKWLQGEPVAEFAPGTVYVVEFWATWCGPCKASIPHLNELHLKFKDQGLVVIGQDCWERNDAAVEPFVRNMAAKMTYRVAADDKSDGGKGKMANAWMSAAGRNAIPAAFIVGKQGKIVWIGHPMKLDETMLGEILGATHSPPPSPGWK
jgi:thiol-disulfide isomerase/thioredoxin